MRQVIHIPSYIVTATVVLISVFNVDESTWVKMSFRDRGLIIDSSPYRYVFSVVLTVWVLIEIIVVTTNQKRRAIHDYVAGTVVKQLSPQDCPDRDQTDAVFTDALGRKWKLTPHRFISHWFF